MSAEGGRIASTRDRHLREIVAVLRAAAAQGILVDEHDFEHVRDDALGDADADGRQALRSITWDEVRGRL